MPYRRTKFYQNGFYHIYNRGVEKRDIFLDQSDYASFIAILKAYLLPPQETFKQGRTLRIRNHQLHEEIKLITYCLMPNHFHLLIQQKLDSSITNFMRRVLTAYSMYFNDKYGRVGSLFQGRFKAKEVEQDEYVLHLSRYIHRNPLGIFIGNVKDLESFSWSSYPVYLGKADGDFTSLDFILSFFPNHQIDSYKKFVEYETELDLSEDLKLEE